MRAPLSSIVPFISILGLGFILFFVFVVDFELDPLRFVVVVIVVVVVVFNGISASFSGDESDDPLSA